MFKIKRIYEVAERSDGYRILIDRLWPRGVSKAKAKIDLWLKEIAPSTELRESFRHEPDNWPLFEKAYKKELQTHANLIQQLKELESKEKTITLLFGAKETRYNNAVVLLDVLVNS